MAKQEALDRAYMNCALAIAELSHANRKKVGAILVTPGGGIIAEGYNGTPSGFDNECETYYMHTWSYGPGACLQCGRNYNPTDMSCKLITKPEVLHAESNAIMKVARSTNSSNDATLYVTMSPCFDCAKLIIQAGIKRVVYLEAYRNTDGVALLEKAKIRVDMLPENHDHKDHGPLV